MSTIASLPDLREALQKANGVLSKSGHTVAVIDQSTDPKQPVFLQLQTESRTRNIGITHLVHLTGSDWSDRPWQEIARTVDEIAQAIVDRVALFFEAEKRGLLIDENGTIFDFKQVAVTVHKNGTFSVNGTLVTYLGTFLLLSRIKSEGIIEFTKMDDGSIQLFDKIDQRVGKGFFINLKGQIYRG